MHGNRDAMICIRCEQIVRKPFRFAAKDEEITLAKFYLVVRTFALRCQKKIARARGLLRLELSERVPHVHIYFIPIIEPGTS